IDNIPANASDWLKCNTITNVVVRTINGTKYASNTAFIPVDSFIVTFTVSPTSNSSLSICANICFVPLSNDVHIPFAWQEAHADSTSMLIVAVLFSIFVIIPLCSNIFLFYFKVINQFIVFIIENTNEVVKNYVRVYNP